MAKRTVKLVEQIRPSEPTVEEHLTAEARLLSSLHDGRRDDVLGRARAVAARLQDIARDIDRYVGWAAPIDKNGHVRYDDNRIAELGENVAHRVTWGYANLNIDSVVRAANDFGALAAKLDVLAALVVLPAMEPMWRALWAGAQEETHHGAR